MKLEVPKIKFKKHKYLLIIKVFQLKKLELIKI